MTRMRFAALAVACCSLITVYSTSAMPEQVSDSPLPVRGLVRPLNQAALTTDLQVPISEIRFKEGEAFRKGDLLVAFNCERLKAERTAAKAQFREMKVALESATYLSERGAGGRFDIEISRARADKAAADVAAYNARIKHCQIFAPYDGRISELLSRKHETPASGQPFIRLIDETQFEVDMIVPSHWLRTLNAGAEFTFKVDELGETFDGKVVRIGAAVDPVSQTIKIVGVFSSKPGKVLAGMSGSAVFVGHGS